MWESLVSRKKPIACRLEKDLGGHPHTNCNDHRSHLSCHDNHMFVLVPVYTYVRCMWQWDCCFSGSPYPLTVVKIGVKIGQVAIHLASSVFISDLLEELTRHFLL